jgi:hypothetical protein
MHITIPHTVANPEEFVALKVRLRTLLGMPAELIPHTLPLLRDRLVISGSNMRNWLCGNGYWVRVGVSNTLAIEKRVRKYQLVRTQSLYNFKPQRMKNWIP